MVPPRPLVHRRSRRHTGAYVSEEVRPLLTHVAVHDVKGDVCI